MKTRDPRASGCWTAAFWIILLWVGIVAAGYLLAWVAGRLVR